VLIASPWNPTSQVDSSLGCRTAFLNWFHCAHAARGAPGLSLGGSLQHLGLHLGILIGISGNLIHQGFIRGPCWISDAQASKCKPCIFLHTAAGCAQGDTWNLETMDCDGAKTQNVHWKLAVSDPFIPFLPTFCTFLYNDRHNFGTKFRCSMIIGTNLGF
jgi:hypothetical protein